MDYNEIVFNLLKTHTLFCAFPFNYSKHFMTHVQKAISFGMKAPHGMGSVKWLGDGGNLLVIDMQ